MKKIILLIVLVLALFSANTIYAASGNCGDNVSWTLDNNGVLTISGTGKMTDYLIEDKTSAQYGWFYYTPWQDFNQSIKQIIVKDGVTSIGSRAFAQCSNLRSVSLSNTVTFIGSQAFIDCANLETINMPPNLTKMGNDVFSGCTKLANLKSSAADLGKTAAISTNINENNYRKWSKPVKSYLYVDGENLVRVECIGGQIIVEKYSPDFQIISAKRLESDISEVFGGFFAGKNYNFIIVGKQNMNQNNNVDVFKIIKYDKNFQKIAETSLKGANTIDPFSYGSLRCAESGDILYIHTCHRMYMTPDRLNHQSNMTFSVRQSNMQITDAQYTVTYNYGYVSHSYNQFILIDNENNIVTFDQGDAYPRAAILQRYINKAGNDKFASKPTSIELKKFPQNNYQYQRTGASIGGLAETKSYYVTAYNDDGLGGTTDYNDDSDSNNSRSIFVTFTSKNNFSIQGTTTIKFDGNFDTPFIIPVNLEGGYIIWKASNSENIYCSHYDNTKNVTETKSFEGSLSDCQPIIYNNKIIWYVTNDSKPVFYTLDETGLSTHKL